MTNNTDSEIEEHIKDPWYKVDKKLVVAKIFYTFFFGALACIGPFLPIFYKSRGLNNQEVGILGAIRPTTNFIAAPLWGAIADKTQKQRLVFLFTLISSTLIRFSTGFVGKGLFSFALVLFFTEALSSPVLALVDNGVLELLGPTKKQYYGRQRLWGAVGWGTAALIIGYAVSSSGDEYLIFYSYLAVNVVAIVTAFQFKIPNGTASPPIWHSLAVMWSSVEVAIFFLVVLIMGMATGIIYNFSFIYLKELGANETLMGLTLTINCVAELPLFFFSGKLIEVLGSKGVLIMAMLCFVIRFGYYSILWNPWAVLPAELLHGVTYAVLWSACISFAHSVAPPGLGATTQGLLSGIFGGLGEGLGALIGGAINHRYGAKVLFQSTAVVVLVSAILFWLSGLSKKKSAAPSYNKLEELTEEELVEQSQEEVNSEN